MPVRLAAIPSILVITLAGCAPARPVAAGEAGGASARYRCDDGRMVDAVYSTRGDAVLEFDGRTVALRQAVSADGARYVGAGWQWWSRGMTEATLAPLAPGETIASAAGSRCRAG